MPLVVRHWSPTPQVARYQRPEFQHPSTDGLVADFQSSLSQQIVDISITQREAQIEPDSVPNYIGREAVAGV
jgi:hypothetical protein